MTALTAAGCSEQFNLERLELLGDSVLKFAVTAQLFCFRGDERVGRLCDRRAQLISNHSLFLVGRDKQLAGYTSASPYQASKWLPPCYKPAEVLGEKGTKSHRGSAKEDGLKSREGHQRGQAMQVDFNDKLLADAVEALVGSFFYYGGLPSALSLCRWLGVFDHMPDRCCLEQNLSGREPSCRPSVDTLLRPRPPLSPLEASLRASSCSSSSSSPSSSSSFMDGCAKLHHCFDKLRFGLEELEDMLGYRFRDVSLLVEAVTHPSYRLNTATGCYERLELLGDAIMDILVVRQLFVRDARLEKMPEGALSDMRACLVANVTFGRLAVKWGIYRYVLIGITPRVLVFGA